MTSSKTCWSVLSQNFAYSDMGSRLPVIGFFFRCLDIAATENDRQSIEIHTTSGLPNFSSISSAVNSPTSLYKSMPSNFVSQSTQNVLCPLRSKALLMLRVPANSSKTSRGLSVCLSVCQDCRFDIIFCQIHPPFSFKGRGLVLAWLNPLFFHLFCKLFILSSIFITIREHICNRLI